MAPRFLSLVAARLFEKVHELVQPRGCTVLKKMLLRPLMPDEVETPLPFLPIVKKPLRP